MKKLILAVLITLTALSTKSQIYLGVTAERYKSLLYRDNIQYKSSYENGDYYLTFTVNNVSYATAFQQGGYSHMIVAMPKTRGTLNALIERYNTEAVVNDEGSWTLYLGGSNSPIDIKMLRIEKGIGYVFVYINH